MATFFPYCSSLFAAVMFLLILNQPTAATYRPSPWKWAHATFYGDETASGTMGGACGYGNLFTSGYGTDTAALSPGLFMNGYGCGICYQVKCASTPACNKNVLFTTITVTNLSPPDWEVKNDIVDRLHLNPNKVHFDLSKPAFMKIADWKAGIIPIAYRRVPCVRSGGLKFTLQGNGSWLLVFVMNVGGAGDIANVWVKGGRNNWTRMTHNWGASYSAFASLGGQSLSFKVQSYTTKEIVAAYNVAPANWQVDRTYKTFVNFQ